MMATERMSIKKKCKKVVSTDEMGDIIAEYILTKYPQITTKNQGEEL